MTPADFIHKWQDNKLSERAGAQAHFLDLCDLLGMEKPADPDNYCFERGAKRTGAGRGWAAVRIHPIRASSFRCACRWM